jgi:hypothetical protein
MNDIKDDTTNPDKMLKVFIDEMASRSLLNDDHSAYHIRGDCHFTWVYEGYKYDFKRQKIR